MCLALFAFQAHPDYDWILAHNRDEFYQRSTAPAAFWAQHPDLLAGRDLSEGGTWLGVTRNGRFALVTNVRNPAARKDKAKSRGHLVKDYLVSTDAPAPYLRQLEKHVSEYNGFNLLVGDRGAIHYLSSEEGGSRASAPGIYGLSNGKLDAPWPKVTRGKKAFVDAIQRPNFTGELLSLMADTTSAGDSDLPDTGVGTEMERVLSPIFVKSPTYGTRATTVILLGKDGTGVLIERSYPMGGAWNEKRFSFDLV